jgi:hypothetical protein
MADLWSDYSDGIIKSIDRQISAKYKITLRSLLTDPSKYASVPNILMTIDNLKEEVNNFMTDRFKGLDADKKSFEDATMRADSITSQIAQSISVQAKQSGVPMIKPIMVDRDTTRDEHIYIDSVDNSITALIAKLVSSSMLIMDSTTVYENYKTGEWLFSGSKNYLLTVYLPVNNYSVLQASREEITSLLDTASDFIKGS